MSGTVTDPLLEEIRITSVVKHIFIVIALDNQVMGFVDVIGHFIGNIADVGCQREFVIAKLEEISGVIAAVVRNIESGNPEIFNLKRFPFFDNLFV